MPPACAEGKQASKSPGASLCFIPGSTGVLSPESAAGMGAQGDQGSFDATGLFTNDVRYPVPLGAVGIEQRRLWVRSACQASPGSTEPKCSFTFPSSQDLFHPFFDLPLPLLLLLFFFQCDLLLCAGRINPFIPPCPHSRAGGSCLGRWVISKVKQHLGVAPRHHLPPSSL